MGVGGRVVLRAEERMGIKSQLRPGMLCISLTPPCPASVQGFTNVHLESSSLLVWRGPSDWPPSDTGKAEEAGH